MEMINACLCCMLRPPDKDVSTPYPRAGSTEIYSDMLEYCFQIQLTAGGICEECVGQLRDARDFRLQVECSQARLQAQLRPWPPLEDEAAGCLAETCPDEASDESAGYLPETCSDEATDESAICLSKSCSEEVNDEPSPIVIEIDSDSEAESCTLLCGAAPASPSNDTGGPAIPARARQQLAMSCCVRLERLRPEHPPAGAPHSFAPVPRVPTRRLSVQQGGWAPYFCFFCKRQFTEISYLVAHMETHAGKKPYSCRVCCKMFAIKSHLTLHSKVHNGNYNRFATDKYIIYKTNKLKTATGQNKCDVCGKFFSRKSHLIEHERVHSEGKSYRCEECNKLYTSSSSLEKHMRYHKGIKPHACDICKERFKYKFNLFIHMRTHSRSKSYTCEVFNTKYAHSSDVSHHKITKEGFKKRYYCQKCKITCITKKELIQHKRTHTDVNKK